MLSSPAARLLIALAFLLAILGVPDWVAIVAWALGSISELAAVAAANRPPRFVEPEE